MALHKAPERQVSGFFSAFLMRAVRLVGFLIGALVLAVVVEWVGMLFFWEEPGAEHSEWMVMSEYQALDLAITEDAFAGRHVAALAIQFVGKGYWLLAQCTGIEYAAVLASQWSESSAVVAYAQAALNSIQAFLLRLIVVILAVPAFVLVAIMCGVEGLMRRALRRYGGGHESAYVFHHAKRAIAPSIYLPVIVYLSWPAPLSPLSVFLPALLVFSIALTLTVSKFKKFL